MCASRPQRQNPPQSQADKIAQILERDGRYSADAYEYLANAVPLIANDLASRSDMGRLGKHISGQELTNALREMLLREFGRMTIDVLAWWGVHETADFGNIVYNLVDAKILSTSPQDSRSDFDNVFDFQEVFVKSFMATARPTPLPPIDFL